MTPDDPRHGTEPGHTQHYRDGEKSCPTCLEAHRKAQIIRRLYPHKTSALGTQRRIQALQALGHSRQRIAEEMGYGDLGALTRVMRCDTILIRTAKRAAEAYDRLSMVVPQGGGPERARTWARRHGFAPPLAWDNIDDPDERPMRGVDRHGRSHDSYDDAAVVRLLDGDTTVHSTRPEREEAMRRWLAAGRSEKSLCQIHGWHDGRYKPRDEELSA